MSVMVVYHCDRLGCDSEEEIPLVELLCDEHGKLRELTTFERLVPYGWAYEHGPEGDDLRCPNHLTAQMPRRRGHR